MRHRIGMSCAAISGVACSIVALASCEDSSTSSGQTFDGSLSPDVSRDAVTADQFVPQDAAPDTTVVDAGCAPGSLAGFTVPAYVPARDQTFACLAQEWTPFSEACAGDASTYAACNTFISTGGEDGGPIPEACATCLDPSTTDAGAGPVVRGSVIAANVAGCVERASRSDAGFDCARTIAAAAACVEYVCKPSCPVSDEPSRHAYQACATTAAAGACLTYTQAATSCVNSVLDGGSSELTQFCFPTDGPPALQFAQIARYFCYS